MWMARWSVLSLLMMYCGSSLEACRRLREQPWGKSAVLVAVTGWGQEGDRRRSHEAGFDQHMVKPVDPSGLMKTLAALGAVRD